METPAKARSVGIDGQPDGFVPEPFFRPEILGGGVTRLVVSLPADRLEPVHRALVSVLEPPLKVLYVQLTDRALGQLAKARNRVAVEIERERLLDVLDRVAELVYRDGRHQFWVRGAMGEQLVLEETGVVFVYPDDPTFRDVLEGEGLPERTGLPSLGERDYLRVEFLASCDREEDELISSLGLVDQAG